MRFLKAERLFNGKEFLGPDEVLVLNTGGDLYDIISEKELDPNRIERFEGIICPGFVNTHCHSELSHLIGKIPKHSGLVDFAKQLMILRPLTSIEEISEHVQEADKNMLNKGIVVVGDICNKNDSFRVKADSKIYYHSFIELIGLNPVSPKSIVETGTRLLDELKHYDLPGSLTPHAPYSVSEDLIKEIAVAAHQQHLPISIHNQESEDEISFLLGKQSKFNELYAFLKLDISWYKAPESFGPRYLNKFLEKNKCILVHNTFSDSKDMEAAVGKNYFWCFCPNANLYIEDRLPDFQQFDAFKSSICFGTDSLASNHSLDLLSEANLILANYSGFSLENCLSSLTSIGAEALGLSEKFGNFIIGKNAGLNLIEFKSGQIQFKTKIC